MLSKANKFERCYMFVLDKAHHVPESSTEIVRTKMFGCTDCGSCKQVKLVSMERLMEMREFFRTFAADFKLKQILQ